MIMEKGMLMTLEVAFKFIIGSIIGYLMYKFKRLEEKSEQSLNEQEARQLIQDKMEPLQVRIEELKEDSRRMESKIDRIIEKL
jgi:Tfp pilus assembly protein PilO